MNKQMILSLLIACSIVLGGFTLMNHDPQQLKQKEHETEPETIPRPKTINQTRDQKDAGATVKITKCTIGDKVLYSDKPCPKNAVISQVEIHQANDFVTPSRDVVERTMKKIAEERSQDVQSSKTHVLLLGKQGNKANCDSYKTSIDAYNTMARQPLPGQTQDWIRSEIVKIRAYQAAASC